MKKALSFAVLAFFGPALFLACASGDGNTGGAGGESSTTVTTSPATTTGAGTTGSTSAASTTGSGQMCGACNIDSDCANTCPATPANQSNCCDTMTHMCFVNISPQCPVSGTSSSASTGTGMY